MNSNGVLPLVVACGLAVAAGMFAPQLWDRVSGDAAKKSVPKSATNPDGSEKVIGPYVQFDRVTVNLNEDELNRSFLLQLTLQCNEGDEEALDLVVRRRRPILKTWLTAHLAEKTLESLRGRDGVERLRREIEDNFNQRLFPDGSNKLVRVHFDEYFVEPGK